MAGKPVPANSYLETVCEFLGVFNGRKRWRSLDGKRLYEWDALHGEIEVYNRRGKHLRVLDTTGKPIKDAVEGRKITV